MKKEKELRNKLYEETLLQKRSAWNEKDYKKSFKIRQKEKINYEKWKLLDGIIKAKEKDKNV